MSEGPRTWSIDLFESAPDGIVLVGSDGVILRVNPQMERLTGHDAGELVGQPYSVLLPARVHERHRELERRYLEDPVLRPMGGPTSVVVVRRKDGSEMPADISLSPLSSTQGRQIIVFVRDATALRTAEERLERLQAVTAQLSGAHDESGVADVIFSAALSALGARSALLARVVDGGARLRIVRSTELSGAEEEQWKRAFLAAGSPPPQPGLPTAWPYVSLAARTPLVDAVRTLTPVYLDETSDWHRDYPPDVVAALALHPSGALACLPLRIREPGAQLLAIGGLRVSFTAPHTFTEEERAFALALADQCALALHRAHLYEENRAARELAERAIRQRDLFLAAVSHELRAPMAALRLWASVLRSGKGGPEARDQALAAIEESVTVQSRVVDDLLDVARAASGKLVTNLQPVSMEAVLRSAVEAALPDAAARAVDLRAEVPRGLGLVSGDDVRLRQIIGNLLSNAIKFTAAGGRATLRARREGAQVSVEVEDTGRGFPPEHAEALFEPFYQVRPGGDTHGGLGLGLAIARQLAHLHGGTISASSEGPGRGARFVLSLPSLAERDEVVHKDAERTPPVSNPLRDRLVMVVDDDATIRHGLMLILEMAGARVEGAASSSAAWERMSARPPDLLVSDVWMPGEDGLLLVRRLRQSPVPSLRALPAIAVTGRASSMDRQRAFEAGFNAFLAKPVAVEDLIHTASQLLAASS